MKTKNKTILQTLHVSDDRNTSVKIGKKETEETFTTETNETGALSRILWLQNISKYRIRDLSLYT